MTAKTNSEYYHDGQHILRQDEHVILHTTGLTMPDEINRILTALNAQPEPFRMPEPPKDRRWHRDDWTAEMLPGDFRPLMVGERPLPHQDEYRNPHSMSWYQVAANEHGEPNSPLPSNSTYFFRTKRPLPPEPKPVEHVPWTKPEHVPIDPCYIRNPVTDEKYNFCGALIVGIIPGGIYILHGLGEIHLIDWNTVAKNELVYSTDRKTWAACTVPCGEVAK